jgi:hypothetical protein
MVEMKHGLLESASLLWKALEEIYGSSNIENSSLKIAFESTSSSTEPIVQEQIVQ